MNKLFSISMCALIAGALTTTIILAEPQNGEGKGKGKGQRKSPAEIFDKIDADGSGGITIKELAAAREVRKARHEERRERKGDGDGHQNKGARSGERPTPPPVEDVFARMDADGDGSISKSEFINAVDAHRNKKGEGRQRRKNDKDTI